MAKPVLSEEELAALTEAMSEEEQAGAVWDALPPLPQPEQVESFAWGTDFGESPERYPLLMNLHERLAESLRDWLAELFGREVRVNAQAPVARPYGELIKRQAAALWMVFEEQQGRWLGWVDLSLVVACVDAMLAGTGEVEQAPSQLTAVERKLARHLADEIGACAVRAWQPVRRCTLVLRKMDVEAQFLAAAPPEEICFAFEWSIDAGEHTRGALGIAYPRSWLEPDLERLRTPVGSESEEAVDPEWQKALIDAVSGAPVALSLELARLSLSIGEFLALKPGDELALAKRKDEPAWLVVRGVPVARVLVGEHAGMLAAEVLERIGTGGE